MPKKIIRIDADIKNGCNGCFLLNVAGCRQAFDCVNPTPGIFVEVEDDEQKAH